MYTLNRPDESKRSQRQHLQLICSKVCMHTSLGYLAAHKDFHLGS